MCVHACKSDNVFRRQGVSTHSINLYVTHAAGAAAYCTHRPVLMPRERRHSRGMFVDYPIV